MIPFCLTSQSQYSNAKGLVKFIFNLKEQNKQEQILAK